MVSKGEDAVERAGKAVLTAALPLNRWRDLDQFFLSGAQESSHC